ncbi:MAG: hypothetical protein JWO57_3153 [Pseudonocardiales bacterium]|nr:hypothetical protein [Pseudonocardiales bacterium]
MAKAVLIVFTSPAGPDTEAAFNDWYDNTHVGEIRRTIPSVTVVSRYRQVDVEGTGGPTRYVAVYEIDTDDVSGAFAAVAAATQAGQIHGTDSMDLATAPPVLVWAQGV